MKFITPLIAAMAFTFGTAVVGHGAEPTQTDFPKTGVSELTVKGDVLMTEGEFCIVKDVTGHEVRLHVNKETKLEGRLKVGDKIEARVTPDGHAKSIVLQIPQN